MAKRKKRYISLSDAKKSSEKTPKQQRAEFPDKLVKAFIKLKLSDFEDQRAYNKYLKQAKEHLGKNAEDEIDQGKLIVVLSRATLDLFNGKKKKTKEEQEETKSKETKTKEGT